MKVTNYDKNGNKIEDMSKVKLPKDLQKQILQFVYKNKKKANQ